MQSCIFLQRGRRPLNPRPNKNHVFVGHTARMAHDQGSSKSTYRTIFLPGWTARRGGFAKAQRCPCDPTSLNFILRLWHRTIACATPRQGAKGPGHACGCTPAHPHSLSRVCCITFSRLDPGRNAVAKFLGSSIFHRKSKGE